MMPIECIKFPECVGCDKVFNMIWRDTGAKVRVCRVYRAPRHWWRRGGCPIRHISHTHEFGNKEKAGYIKRKDAEYLTKRGRVAT